MKLLTWMHWLQDLNWGNGKIWGSGVVPQYNNFTGNSSDRQPHRQYFFPDFRRADRFQLMAE
ncbi:hypothetical protein SAMN03159353_10923 [Cedecea sp. NFIX57]|nr:hypothetical protein SAMN03159353_10923 [Cedecea sp. NFIX57]